MKGETLNRFDVISFDMFQTLADVNMRIPFIWQAILKEDYSEKLGTFLAEKLIENLPYTYRKSSSPFLPMKSLFLLCAERVIEQTGIKATADEMVKVIMEQHSYAPFYEEVKEVLSKLKEKFTIIISSDSNHLMTDRLLQELSVDKVFISDDLRSYKCEENGAFFRKVQSVLSISPDRILHIGDSKADIIGAKEAGMSTCLIDRDNHFAEKSLPADYVVSNLRKLLKIVSPDRN